MHQNDQTHAFGVAAVAHAQSLLQSTDARASYTELGRSAAQQGKAAPEASSVVIHLRDNYLVGLLNTYAYVQLQVQQHEHHGVPHREAAHRASSGEGGLSAWSEALAKRLITDSGAFEEFSQEFDGFARAVTTLVETTKEKYEETLLSSYTHAEATAAYEHIRVMMGIEPEDREKCADFGEQLLSEAGRGITYDDFVIRQMKLFLQSNLESYVGGVHGSAGKNFAQLVKTRRLNLASEALNENRTAILQLINIAVGLSQARTGERDQERQRVASLVTSLQEDAINAAVSFVLSDVGDADAGAGGDQSKEANTKFFLFGVKIQAHMTIQNGLTNVVLPKLKEYFSCDQNVCAYLTRKAAESRMHAKAVAKIRIDNNDNDTAWMNALTSSLILEGDVAQMSPLVNTTRGRLTQVCESALAHVDEIISDFGRFAAERAFYDVLTEVAGMRLTKKRSLDDDHYVANLSSYEKAGNEICCK